MAASKAASSDFLKVDAKETNFYEAQKLVSYQA